MKNTKEKVKWYNYIFAPGGIILTLLIAKIIYWLFTHI